MKHVLEGGDGNTEKRCTEGSRDQRGQGGGFQPISKRRRCKGPVLKDRGRRTRRGWEDRGMAKREPWAVGNTNGALKVGPGRLWGWGRERVTRKQDGCQ